MVFAGLQKLTLLDFPGRVACTVFVQGCDFRCPFCHNSSLLDARRAPQFPVSEEEVIDYLQKRRGVLDGLCITGGEPLLLRGTEAFLRRVHELGLAVKLDTNGSFPDKLRRFIEAGLVDTVAMDIKNAPARYGETIGIPEYDLTNVRQSVTLLMENRVPFEFRTTCVAGLHTEENMEEIGLWLRGDEPYFLQRFVNSESVLCPGLAPCEEEQMRRFVDILRPYLPNVSLRGI